MFFIKRMIKLTADVFCVRVFLQLKLKRGKSENYLPLRNLKILGRTYFEENDVKFEKKKYKDGWRGNLILWKNLTVTFK